jgi:hypothetical protein
MQSSAHIIELSKTSFRTLLLCPKLLGYIFSVPVGANAAAGYLTLSYHLDILFTLNRFVPICSVRPSRCEHGWLMIVDSMTEYTSL